MLAAHARRLIVLLAALTALMLASAVSALAAAGAHNGVRVLSPAGQARAWLTSLESPCTRRDFTGSTARSVAGFCVAAEDAPMGESSLASGATVNYSDTATAIGDDENTLQNFARSQGADGHDVIVHGAAVDGDGTQFFVNGLPTHAQQIADAVLGNPDYAGGPINLVTCGGACGPAQELGEILGVDVRASSGNVDLDPGTGSLRELP